MKTFQFLIFMAFSLIASYSLIAQSGVWKNNDGSAADGSAILDVKSTEKGFLPPRMTGAQRDVISSPVAGLVIWCNNCGENGELQVFNGTEWTNLVGETAAVSFTCGDNISDYDGNTYGTVLIGSQCWMKENLKTKSPQLAITWMTGIRVFPNSVKEYSTFNGGLL